MPDDLPPDEPTSLAEWLWYVRYYERRIFVREEVDGAWGNYALAALEPRQWAEHLARWLEEGHVPYRVIAPPADPTEGMPG